MHPRRLEVLSATPFPAYVVWELTLRCDHACTHCGSRAGHVRPSELDTDEAVATAARLAGMGAREVVLIGGEAYLHEGFLDVVRALVRGKVNVQVTTGGRGIDAELARAMADAGVMGASVSIDGLADTHDHMRASPGSFAAATRALGHLRAAGLHTSSNINLNRFNHGDLEAVYDHVHAAGVGSWQVQLTAPLGRAADRPELLLQPWDLLTLVPRVAALKQRARADGVLLMPGNNLGYFGPEEAALRSLEAGGRDHFQGCQAGRFVMGIESDGAVKGCPSLQSAHYVGGNLRQQAIEEIWRVAPQVAFARARTRADLWGFCRDCAYADTCLGGCTFTAHALLGRSGNNPYCHHRARTLARAGQRERLVQVEAAPGTPFDNGRFDLVLEALDAPDPGAAVPARERLVQLRRSAAPEPGR